MSAANEIVLGLVIVFGVVGWFRLMRSPQIRTDLQVVARSCRNLFPKSTAAEQLQDRLDVLSEQPLPPLDWPVEPSVLRRAAITEIERRRRVDASVASNIRPFQRSH